MTIQLETVRAALIRVTGESKNGRFRCPYHGGTDYNLAIRDSRNKIQITCFSHHCDGVNILASIDLKLSDIYYENKLSKKTANWILSPDRLERCHSIVMIHASILERNPNHEFGEQDSLVWDKAKTELKQHYRISYGSAV